MKLLLVDPSDYDDAPVEGIRRILEEFTGDKILRSAKVPTDKIEWVRMEATVATNAPLERGENCTQCDSGLQGSAADWKSSLSTYF